MGPTLSIDRRGGVRPRWGACGSNSMIAGYKRSGRGSATRLVTAPRKLSISQNRTPPRITEEGLFEERRPSRCSKP